MILTIPLLIIGSILMTGIHVMIFKSFPRCVRKLICFNVFLGTLCDFCLSGLILIFTGPGNTIGFLSLIGSGLFAGYLVIYRKKHGIGEIKIDWRWGVVPKIDVRENGYSHWLF